MNNVNSESEHTGSVEEMMGGVRDSAAESLASAANSVRAAGYQGAYAISDLANEAGEKLDSTADYVRTFADGDVFRRVRKNVRRHPVASVALAAAVGVLAGFSYRRSRAAAC